MSVINDFPIANRWPPVHPDAIQLYSLGTPNGAKVSIALEEMGLPYDAHFIDFSTNDQKSPEFLSLNPNGKIPAILDPKGPNGKPIAIFESGAILFYLAEKSGKLMPADPAGRYQTLQWMFFQVGGIGPMFGQLGYFVKFAGKDIDDKRPRERYVEESKRLLGVLETALTGKDWLLGRDYSVADIATFPWVRTLRDYYGAGDLVGLGSFKAVNAWLERALDRPAVQRGLQIPVRPAIAA